jgi:hypothetical protein
LRGGGQRAEHEQQDPSLCHGREDGRNRSGKQ